MIISISNIPPFDYCCDVILGFVSMFCCSFARMLSNVSLAFNETEAQWCINKCSVSITSWVPLSQPGSAVSPFGWDISEFQDSQTSTLLSRKSNLQGTRGTPVFKGVIPSLTVYLGCLCFFVFVWGSKFVRRDGAAFNNQQLGGKMSFRAAHCFSSFPSIPPLPSSRAAQSKRTTAV